MKTLMGSIETLPPSLTEDATGTVVQKVAQTAGAVSYASFSGTHNAPGVSEVAIDGAAATEENVITGKYPFWSYEHIYTNGPPSKDIAKFIAFLQEDTAVFKKTGYILIRDMKVTENSR
jgi:phosphate transport system substrate-binding protein